MSSWTVERLSQVGIKAIELEVVDDGDESSTHLWRLEDHGGDLPTEPQIQALVAQARNELRGTPQYVLLRVKGDEEQYPAASTLSFDEMGFSRKPWEEACDLYERVAPLIGMQVENEDEEEPDETWALVDEATGLAIKCLLEGIPFSLVGYSLRENGEGATHHITASNDQEMFDKATKAMALAPTVGFALIGEGTVYDPNDNQAPALFCYFQNRSMEGPAQMFKPYRRSPAGIELMEEDWILAAYVEGSWL